MHGKLLALGAALSLVAGCMAPAQAPGGLAGGALGGVPTGAGLPPQSLAPQALAPLSGQVQWAEGRGLLATEAQVVDRATVSLIDASTGRTALSGVTDASGNFSLIDDSATPTFSPSVNQLFILEAVKGLPNFTAKPNAAGKAAARLRTVARYTGSSPVWQSASFSGTTHFINQATTAQAIALSLQGQDAAATSPNAFDRAISSFTAPATYLGTAEVPLVAQDHVATLVAFALNTEDLDPVGAIGFAGGNYFVADPAAGVPNIVANNSACTAPNISVPGALTYSLGYRFLYVTNNATNQMRVFRYDTTLTSGACITSFAGAGASGSLDGNATTARFNNPRGICADYKGNLYVADTGNHTIRRVDVAGNVTTFAGAAGVTGTADGAATATARFNAPEGLTTDGQGNLYVGESGNNRIRKIVLATGVVSTLSITTNAPVDVTGMACDQKGNLYLLDSSDTTGSGKVKRISLANPATAIDIAGLNTGTVAFSAVGTNVRMGTALKDLCYDGQRYLYLSDSGRFNLFRIDTLHPTYATERVAGTSATGSAAGQLGTSSFTTNFYGMAFNPLTQVLYMADGTLLRRLSF